MGLFAADIIPSYSKAFDSLTEPSTKYQFLRVLGTWRGLFPEPVVRELERRHGSPTLPPSNEAVPSSLGTKRSSAELYSRSSSTMPLRPDTAAVLNDLKIVVSMPPHLYNPGRVASIFAHVQIKFIKAMVASSISFSASFSTRCPLSSPALQLPHSDHCHIIVFAVAKDFDICLGKNSEHCCCLDTSSKGCEEETIGLYIFNIALLLIRFTNLFVCFLVLP